MEKSAIISECEKYRYSLSRIWDNSKPLVMFIMLNPSTADADNDDPTIRRCIGYAKDWGYGGIIVCNLFAYRATNPKELLNCDNPFGDENIWHIRQNVDKAEMVITAWGNYPIVDKLLKGLSAFRLIGFAIGRLHYLELSNTRCPKHPLYLKKSLQPKKWNNQSAKASNNNDMEKIKVSAFEYAIAQVASPEESENMIPETRQEEIERRTKSMRENISKFRVINKSGESL